MHQCEVARVVAAHCRHAAANSEACPTHGHTCGDAGVSAKRRTAKPHVWGLSRTFGGYQAEHRKSGLYRTHTSGRRAKHAALMEHRRQHESASEWSRKKNAIERMVQPRPHLCIGRTVSLAAAVCHALIRTIFRVSVRTGRTRRHGRFPTGATRQSRRPTASASYACVRPSASGINISEIRNDCGRRRWDRRFTAGCGPAAAVSAGGMLYVACTGCGVVRLRSATRSSNGQSIAEQLRAPAVAVSAVHGAMCVCCAWRLECCMPRDRGTSRSCRSQR